MKRNRYLYLGDKTGNRIFYDIEGEKFYRLEGFRGGLLTSVIAFAGTIIYTIVRRLNGSELKYNETVFLVCSAIIGIVLSIAFCWYSIKSNNRYFSNAAPLEIPTREQMVKILRQARGITRIYSIARSVIVLMILFLPFIIKEQKNVFLFFTYFVEWFAFGYLFLYFNQWERRKVLKKLKKQYLE